MKDSIDVREPSMDARTTSLLKQKKTANVLFFLFRKKKVIAGAQSRLIDLRKS